MTLSTQNAQTELFERTGTFFAFSQDQYERSALEGVTYVSCGAGMLVPKDNAKALTDGLAEINKLGIETDLKENTKESIIERELFNFECFYTGEIDDCVEALSGYPITESEIKAVYMRVYPTVEL